MSEIMKEIEENVTPVYELRGLKASDLGAICKIISAIGIKEFRSCFESEEIMTAVKKGDANLESIGISIMFDIVGIITSNIPKAEKEIQMFVSSVSGLKLADVVAMPLADYGELIMKIVMMPDFKDFFLRAFKLFK